MLEGRVAVVSGAGPNIGREIANTLAANGASVVCLDIRREAAEATAREVVDRGYEAIAVDGDITKPEDMENLVSQALAAYGHIDILVNNAAITSSPGLLDEDLATFRKIVDVILAGTFNCTQPRRPADGGAGHGRRHRQRRLHVRPPRQERRDRVPVGEGRHPQLHARMRDGARPAQHPRQLAHADADRHAGGRQARAPGRRSAPERAARTLGQAPRSGAGRALPRLRQRGLHHRRRPAGWTAATWRCGSRGREPSPWPSPTGRRDKANSPPEGEGVRQGAHDGRPYENRRDAGRRAA